MDNTPYDKLFGHAEEGRMRREQWQKNLKEDRNAAAQKMSNVARIPQQ